MARTRTAKHPKPAEPEDESQEEPEEEAVAAEREERGSISKSEAARQAIAAGLESPEEATEFIRKKFGIEMSKPHFSAVKSQLKKRAGDRAAQGPAGEEAEGCRRGLSGPTAQGRADRRGRPARRHGGHEAADRVTGG